MCILFADTAHPYLWDSLTAAGFRCSYYEHLNHANAKEYLVDAEGLVIRSRFKMDQELIDASPGLRFIARVGAGMENIDVEYATSRGISCFHAPEGNRNAVAEQALGMLLALFNNLIKADREVRQGVWLREENRGHELSGKTVALIGYGNTGSSFAKRLRGFDINLLVYDKYLRDFGDLFVKEATMEEIFEQADVLSLHIPLNPETAFLVNLAFLNRFRKPIWLINTARGKCVQTDALVEMMENGRVKGVALDVLEYESISFEQMDSMPAAFRYLANSDRVILSPHIAGWTHESSIGMARVLVEKILIHTGKHELLHKLMNRSV